MKKIMIILIALLVMGGCTVSEKHTAMLDQIKTCAFVRGKGDTASIYQVVSHAKNQRAYINNSEMLFAAFAKPTLSSDSTTSISKAELLEKCGMSEAEDYDIVQGVISIEGLSDKMITEKLADFILTIKLQDNDKSSVSTQVNFGTIVVE